MLVFDIETDGLLRTMTKIHTLTIYDTETEKYQRYDKEKVEQGIKRLHSQDIYGHNIIAFDIPAIKKLYPWFKPKSIQDSMVISRVVFADIKETDARYVKERKLARNLVGSHSLKAWGQRLGLLKGNFGETTDWLEWSQEMSDYCELDVKVTVALWQHLEKFKSFLVDEVLQLEHDVQHIISRQIDFGFAFNTDKAEELYAVLIQRQSELLRLFRGYFKPWLARGKEFTPKRDDKKRGYRAGASFTKLDLVEFNPSSRSHIIYQFKKLYGWEPDTFTDSKQAKIDDDVLKELPYPEAKALAEYFLITKRLSQLATGSQGWLVTCDNDGRMRGYVNSNGTVTGRMTHSRPNVAQVPSVSTKKDGDGNTVYLYGSEGEYSTECRELFEVPNGYKLVGCDASGLELRTLSHYLARYDDGAYGREVLEGDIHTANQKSAGLPTRDKAKTFIYAWLYGGGDLMIGLTINNPIENVRKHKQDYPAKFKTFKERFAKTSFKVNGKTYTKVSKGKWKELTDDLVCYAIDGWLIKERFLSNLPALTDLRQAVMEKAKKQKYLRGLDGRILKIRSTHSSLNVLLQSAGAIVMKVYLVLLDRKLQKEFQVGTDYEFVANIHDEVQIQVKDEFAERVAQLCVETFADVTKVLNFRILLEGEAKIGSNWKETH